MAVYTQAGEAEIRRILATPGIHEAIAMPHAVPREARESVAAILARELVLGEVCEVRDQEQATSRIGPAFRLLNAARCTEAWGRLKALSTKSHMIALLCMQAVLEAILDTFDDISGKQLTFENLEAVIEFKVLIAEMFGLHGRKPGLPPGRKPAAADILDEDSRNRVLYDTLYRKLIPRLTDAADEISDSSDAIEIISLLSAGRGWDHAMAELHQDHIHDLKRYSTIMRRNADLMAMIEDIGRASEGTIADGSHKLHSGRSEVHSIITSGDLHYLLPSELIKLRDDVLKYLFFARWAEGKLLTYQLTGRGRAEQEQRRRKGPVVALVDTSGSMDGAPGFLAKAIMLAAARKFLRSGRKIKLALFSSVDQLAEIDIPDGPASRFLDFLGSSFGGGTDFDTALRAGIEALKSRQYQNADILFVTDGMSRITDESLIDEWRRLKETSGSQIFTVIVGNDQAGGLEGISDRVYILGVKGIKV